jgi:Uma2 family endonuclease
MTLSFEKDRRYTVQEYLELEGGSPEEKFEFRDGYVVAMREALAMAGGSFAHVGIASNFLVALSTRLRGGPCLAYGSDLRVRIPRKTLYTYPDISVICGKAEIESHPTAGDTATNPKLIVEVLSASTELFDRGRKFALYREIPSFVEYVLVAQTDPRVEAFVRHEDGGWSFRPFVGVEDTAKFPSINVEIPLREIYDGVTFPDSMLG